MDYTVIPLGSCLLYMGFKAIEDVYHQVLLHWCSSVLFSVNFPLHLIMHATMYGVLTLL